MKTKILSCWLMLIIIMFFGCGQGKKENDAQVKTYKVILGRQHSVRELKAILANDKRHNIIDNSKTIIKDGTTAMHIAEPILFSIYGKQNIVEQKPYEIYLIDKYWVISGTLAQGSKGGTFLIIIDARNSKIVAVTHGK